MYVVIIIINLRVLSVETCMCSKSGPLEQIYLEINEKILV